MRDHLKLQFIVFLWGFTAVIGRLISIPAIELTFYRVLLAAIVLWVVLRVRRIPIRLAGRDVLAILGTGALLGIHWCLFFLSTKISSVSVCMIGIATTALWVALLEPLILRNRRVRFSEVFLGLVAVGASVVIFRFRTDMIPGFLIAVSAALVATLFSIINGRLVTRHHYQVISFYEMAGAALCCLLLLPVAPQLTGGEPGLGRLILSARDFGWLVLLATVCTVYAYSAYVELLRRMTVFTICLVSNLEPVYGIALAAAVFREYEQLGGSFYLGTVILLAAVLAHPILMRRRFPPATPPGRGIETGAGS